VGMAAAGQVATMASVLLPHTLTSVRSARRRIADDLSRRGVPQPIVEDCMLVVSEFLSNALRHARPLGSGKVLLAWGVRDRVVDIQVADGGGPTRPYLQAPSLSSLGGRGLSIVNTITEAWGVRQEAEGTTVWATLPVDGPAVVPPFRERE
jgi:anti-sigma regulatory factor (Ser/Thr protein kinase)